MESLPRIAVVNNDPSLLQTTLDYLHDLNYMVWGESCGGDFYRRLQTNPVDIVILDIDLPGENGSSIVQYLQDMPQLGIIVVSEDNGHEDRTRGLSKGADRYLAKPIHLNELHGNIIALSRRHDFIPPEKPDKQIKHWHLCHAEWTLTSPLGQALSLTDREYQLLLLLLEAHGQKVSKSAIADHIIGQHAPNASLRIDTQLARLRKKAYQTLGYHLPIKTAYQGGYAFTEPLSLRQ